MIRTPDLPPLYPIVDVRDQDAAAGQAALELACALADAGATVVQLRAKPLSSSGLETLAGRMQDELASRGSRLIVNDRTDIACEFAYAQLVYRQLVRACNFNGAGTRLANTKKR